MWVWLGGWLLVVPGQGCNRPLAGACTCLAHAACGVTGGKGTRGQEPACRLCVCTHSPAPLRACGAVGLVLRCVWAQACALLQANGFSVPGVDLYWKAVWCNQGWTDMAVDTL